ncbi:cellulase family glycosylhydrolase [Actinomadura rupiterrae]|uniref:cellulase family glycosylhydrolase n=1 Tax=Actinomadura rupiterrae TaxID=559627 RepID=UPI0020A23EF9|nr:cellulase family glycosylhydrolase [Actinomadura rupiterrae]MCP2335303.1 endoglycosylceramidase [Actinomadura rupiterrae]
MPRPAVSRSVAAARLAVTALLIAAPAAVPTAGTASADQGDGLRQITDAQGRALLLHGMNTAGSAKGPSGLPWIERRNVAAERQKLGSNVVRYIVQWKNVEPSPGRYDDRYLDEVAQRVAWYREQGINVVLDMHQDIYGPSACKGAGNGAPAWATITDGLPCTPQSPWVLTYLQPAVLRAYDNFWNTTGRHPELMRHYVAMWKHVAARFANDPAVLGYDLMNEPFGGTKQFGFFEAPVLTPFYQRIVTAIRQVDRNRWIFLEPQALGVNEGLGTSLGQIRDPRARAALTKLLGQRDRLAGTGLTRLTDPSSRLVLAAHFYPGGVDIGGGYTGMLKTLVQAEFVLWRQNMTDAARRLNTPLWIGEIGAMAFNQPGAADYTRDWLSMADDLRVGWAYWSNDPQADGSSETFAPLDRNGDLTEVGKVVARPFARAVAGTPTKTSYTSGTFTLTWRTRPGTSGPTEIWLPPTVYPGTPKVTASDHTRRWDPTNHVLSIWNTSATTTHTVTITPS